MLYNIAKNAKNSVNNKKKKIHKNIIYYRSKLKLNAYQFSIKE